MLLKKLLPYYLIPAAFLFFSTDLSAQMQVEVPEKLQFADMELTITEDARKQIKADADALLRNPRFFQLKVDRADAYFYIIDRIFEEEKIPYDFRYLVLQESGLVSDAVSSSNAVGFWQFKKESAQEVGLRVDRNVDERMNIASATLGAARYLNRNNGLYQNWVFALLSYNMGFTGAKNITDPSLYGSKTLEINKKTHWYVLKFLSHKLAFETAIGKNPNPPFKVVEYTDSKNKTLKEIAQETNIELQQIKEYNKWLKLDQVPSDKSYTVLLPVKTEEQPALLAAITKPIPGGTPETNPEIKPWKEGLLTSIFKREDKKAEKEEYKSDQPIFFVWNGLKAIQARKGDNSSKLALQAGITRDQFLEYNDLKVYDPIVPGQVYYVKKKRRKARVPYHTVIAGETLWAISQNYGIKLNLLLAKNRMDRPEKLKEGRVLWLRNIRPKNTAIEYKKVEKTIQKGPANVSIQKPAGSGIGADLESVKPQNVATVTQVKASESYKISVTRTEIAEQRIAVLEQPAVKTGAVKAEEMQPASIKTDGRTVSSKAEPVAATNQPKPVAITVIQDVALQNPSVDKEIAAADTVASQASESDIASVGNELSNEDENVLDNENMGSTALAIETGTGSIDSAIVLSDTSEVLGITNLAENTKPTQETKPINVNAKTIFTKHVVEIGQTLFAISRLYETPIDSLKTWNNLPDNSLKLGQEIMVKQISIPGKINSTQKVAPANNTATEKKVYQVKAGDTLYKIARENGVTINELKEWNSKADLNVAVGESLVVGR